jgi:superfamily II DNA/RNA helicase
VESAEFSDAQAAGLLNLEVLTSYDLKGTSGGGFLLAAPASAGKRDAAPRIAPTAVASSAPRMAQPSASALRGGGGGGALGPAVAPARDAAALGAAWAPFCELRDELLANMARLGYAVPTPVQRLVLPAAARHHKDVVATAATGSGKTAAYALPVLQRLLERRAAGGLGVGAPVAGAPPPGRWAALPALVLAPTRELAVQVRAHFAALAAGTAVVAVAVVGGLAQEKQLRLLRAHPDVVVATPGRLAELLAAGPATPPCLRRLHALQFLVMDEADRLIEKGSFEALKAVFAAILPPPPPPSGGAESFEIDEEAEAVVAAALRARGAGGGEEEGEGGGGGSEEPGEALPPPPSALHEGAFKRQTLLFSATLGVASEATVKDAAFRVACAAAGGARPGKRALRASAERVAKMAPMEALMAAVGAGKAPVVISVAREGSGAAAAAAAVARAGGAPAAAVTADAADTAAEAEAAAAHVKRLGDGGAGGGSGGGRAPAAAGSEAAAWAAVEAAGGARGATAAAAHAAAAASTSSAPALPPGLRLARVTVGADADKDKALYSFVAHFPGRTLVFVNTVGALKRVAGLCGALRLPVFTLHAKMQQRARLAHLERFRAAARGILVATDVAARGLDVPAVDHVVHFCMPHSADTFVHRSGRTARGAAAGLALALVGPRDAAQLGRIAAALGAGAGLAEFPLEARTARAVAARVALARAVAAETAALSADSAAQAWMAGAAGEAGLLLEEATAREVGGMGEALAAGLVGRGTGGPAMDFLGTEEERREAEESARERRASLRAKQRALDALLAQPLAPTGVSRRFITSNPELAPTAAPPPAPVLLAATGGGGRSGSALVAPRVVAAPAAPGGAAAGASGALRALAERGRLAHVPAVGVAAAGRSKTAQRKRRR